MQLEAPAILTQLRVNAFGFSSSVLCVEGGAGGCLYSGEVAWVVIIYASTPCALSCG
jgi:hypothetical protein